ncbi:unnamed protein product [Mesocestoides corti]|uniref:DUF7083 domain-containing protein n=1 Tax=Mesocestoides corti TaxID=53468 RepID=A0A3P6HS45_MESCO|nr:unnamed protein product [Mesocestoides corti]
MLEDRQSSQAAPASTPAIDSLTNGIWEFSYDPECGVTFESWYRRFEDLFRVDLSSQDDAWKVRLLTRKLGSVKLKKNTDTFLPMSSLDFTFGEAVQNLKRMYGVRISLFITRCRCLKLATGEFDDFLDHLAVVNRECEESQFKSKLSFAAIHQMPTPKDVPSLRSFLGLTHPSKGIGAVIVHVFPDDTEKAIMYASR